MVLNFMKVVKIDEITNKTTKTNRQSPNTHDFYSRDVVHNHNLVDPRQAMAQ